MTRTPRARRFALVPLLAVLALAWPVRARAQVSPGPLAAPHAAIDGTTQCFQCHARAGAKTGMDARCLACHGEIAWMRTQHRGFHAATKQECATCHPDHGGRDFQMVVWDGGAPEKFDHRRAGFVLEGKHASLACRSCHKPELQHSPAVPLLRRRNHAASWLGLQTACADCHTDPHRGQLGARCTACHSQTAWKPVPGFDHARTAYPLTGAHATVECAKCHAAPQVVSGQDAQGKPLPQWKPLPHADCVTCHKDPHEGRFKGACMRCHVTTGWHTVSRSGFDHDQTHYPLRGRHAFVECAKCHDPRTAFGEKPKFARCMDCHRDAHAGTATRAGATVDCASCHSVEGWTRPLYAVADHASSKYPLQGRHAGVACASCHPKLDDTPSVVAALGTARVRLRPAFAACTACHADPHRGRFDAAGARPHRSGCLDCHTLDRFRPSTYDGRRHAECVFPLTGSHAAVPCQACHKELSTPSTVSSLVADSAHARQLPFDDRRRVCSDCHTDPHAGQFAGRRDHGACDGCHDDRAFAPTAKFDHDRDARYKLDGAHRHVPCASCHVARPGPDGTRRVLYRPTPTRCEACHAGGVRDTSRSSGDRTGSALPARPSDLAPFASNSSEARHGTAR